MGSVPLAEARFLVDLALEKLLYPLKFAPQHDNLCRLPSVISLPMSTLASQQECAEVILTVRIFAHTHTHTRVHTRGTNTQLDEHHPATTQTGLAQ